MCKAYRYKNTEEFWLVTEVTYHLPTHRFLRSADTCALVPQGSQPKVQVHKLRGFLQNTGSSLTHRMWSSWSVLFIDIERLTTVADALQSSIPLLRGPADGFHSLTVWTLLRGSLGRKEALSSKRAWTLLVSIHCGWGKHLDITRPSALCWKDLTRLCWLLLLCGCWWCVCVAASWNWKSDVAMTIIQWVRMDRNWPLQSVTWWMWRSLSYSEYGAWRFTSGRERLPYTYCIWWMLSQLSYNINSRKIRQNELNYKHMRHTGNVYACTIIQIELVHVDSLWCIYTLQKVDSGHYYHMCYQQ